MRVLKDERIIVIAEQRPECSEEEVTSGFCHCVTFASRIVYESDLLFPTLLLLLGELW